MSILEPASSSAAPFEATSAPLGAMAPLRAPGMAFASQVLPSMNGSSASAAGGAAALRTRNGVTVAVVPRLDELIIRTLADNYMRTSARRC